MHQEDWVLDLLRIPEGRHPGVEVGHFPEGAELALKTERSERTIIGAALGKAGAEETRVREQIRRHERAVAMAAHADAIAIAHPHLNDFINRSFGAGDQLLDVMIVGSFARANNRHGWIIEDRVARKQQEEVRIAADNREAIC